MTRLVRLIVWTGGALFVGALGFSAWWYLVPLGDATAFSGWHSLAFDGGLFTLFAVHHSVFARDRVKRVVARLVPVPLLRSVYVWTASLLLIMVCVLWRRVGGEVYRQVGVLTLPHALVQLAGVWLIAQSVRFIDALELAGIRHTPMDEGLQITGPYDWVRHPLYLGWILAVFGHAHMTGDRVAFAGITSLYLLIAIPFEERSLVDTFGDAYRRYQQQVRWRVIPFVY